MKLTSLNGARLAASTLALAGLLTLANPATAGAETQTGWVGSTGPVAGTIYLHSSTINNVPRPLASSVVYTSFGSAAPAGTMGAMARLFKQGTLCAATDYIYNTAPINTQSSAVSRNCGTGNYNSNGFVAVLNGTTYNTYVTFPTNGINYTAPAAAATAELKSSGTNSKGQSLGSAQGASPTTKLPDLVQAIATNGKSGYIKSSALATTPSKQAAAAQKDAAASRTVSVYAEDGTTVVGQFTIATR